MKKITVKKMIENSNIPARLIRAVIRQSGGLESFATMAPDIANHGIDGGFHGWVYYTDTCKFWKNNRKEIMQLAEDLADDLGEGGALGLIQNFGVFRNDPISADELAKALYTGKGDDVTIIENVMAWFAAEEVARLYVDLIEE